MTTVKSRALIAAALLGAAAALAYPKLRRLRVALAQSRMISVREGVTRPGPRWWFGRA
jgi:hypothetical protein